MELLFHEPEKASGLGREQGKENRYQEKKKHKVLGVGGLNMSFFFSEQPGVLPNACSNAISVHQRATGKLGLGVEVLSGVKCVPATCSVCNACFLSRERKLSQVVTEPCGSIAG